MKWYYHVSRYFFEQWQILLRLLIVLLFCQGLAIYAKLWSRIFYHRSNKIEIVATDAISNTEKKMVTYSMCISFLKCVIRECVTWGSLEITNSLQSSWNQYVVNLESLQLLELSIFLTISIIFILPPHVKKYSYLTSTETGILKLVGHWCGYKFGITKGSLPHLEKCNTRRPMKGRPDAWVLSY